MLHRDICAVPRPTGKHQRKRFAEALPRSVAELAAMTRALRGTVRALGILQKPGRYVDLEGTMPPEAAWCAEVFAASDRLAAQQRAACRRAHASDEDGSSSDDGDGGV